MNHSGHNIFEATSRSYYLSIVRVLANFGRSIRPGAKVSFASCLALASCRTDQYCERIDSSSSSVTLYFGEGVNLLILKEIHDRIVKGWRFSVGKASFTNSTVRLVSLLARVKSVERTDLSSFISQRRKAGACVERVSTGASVGNLDANVEARHSSSFFICSAEACHFYRYSIQIQIERCSKGSAVDRTPFVSFILALSH